MSSNEPERLRTRSSANEQVEFTVPGVTNTGSAGVQSLTVSTSSDTVPTNTPIAIGPPTAPTFTSGNGATFVTGTGGNFAVTASGVPLPPLSTSALPAGITFADHHNGTGTLSVAPSVAVGVITITLTADNGVGSPAHQTFTVTVLPQPPTVTNVSPNTGPAAGVRR